MSDKPAYQWRAGYGYIPPPTPTMPPSPAAEPEPICLKSSPDMVCVETGSRRVCFKPPPAYLGVHYQPAQPSPKSTSQQQQQQKHENRDYLVPPPPMPPGVRYVAPPPSRTAATATTTKQSEKAECEKANPEKAKSDKTKSEKAKSDMTRSEKARSETVKTRQAGSEKIQCVKSHKSSGATGRNPLAPPSLRAGENYMFHRQHTRLHIFSKAAQVWKEKYKGRRLGFKIFKVATNFTVRDVIDKIVPEDKDRNEWVVTEVFELGGGSWQKGTTIEHSSDKAGAPLDSIGWTAKRGKDLPPVWITIHQVKKVEEKACHCAQ